MNRRKLIPLIFIVLVYLTVEAISYLGLWYAEERFGVSYQPVLETLSDKQKASLRRLLARGEGERVDQDPVLGWEPSSLANSAGMRDDREYETVPSPEMIRISAFGDSFTFASDVELEESWGKQLSALEPSIEVLNYGAGAYGLDQAYLRYLKRGTEYNPDIVFIGYMSENIARNVNVFRPFYSRLYGDAIFTKPRFKVENGSLILLENPISTMEDHEDFLNNDSETLRTIGENDYYYQMGYRKWALDFFPSVRFFKVFISKMRKIVLYPIFNYWEMYDENSEAYEITLKIFDAFYHKVLASGALPVIVVFPDSGDQRRSRAKISRRYVLLLDEFRARGYRFIDLMDALEPIESRHTIKELTVAWGHFSPLGNRILAEYMLGRLRTWGYVSRPKVEEAFRRERAGDANSSN